MKQLITVAFGDGIGPEIMTATLSILEAAGAQIEIEKVEIGEKVYLSGHPTGIEDRTWDSIRKTKVLLKGPITTPQGGGFKSLNVTIRTSLGLYANVRPCLAYSPFIQTKHPNMDLVIIRENEEDLYTGIEYQQTPDVCHAIKLISYPGSKKIIRYAFEYAKLYGRKKVTCFTKDNILKMSDGLFHKTFEEIGKDYPDIEKEHWIIDIGTALLADSPEKFDVLVLPNLYGDILSDVAAQISGSVGLAGSANIGEMGAMFEAVHGSAPNIAGKDLANPSGLLLAAIYLLLHIKQPEPAELIHNAWLKTIEDGIQTADIFKEDNYGKKVGTRQFAEEVIKRLGLKPTTLKAVHYSDHAMLEVYHDLNKYLSPKRELVGVDVYLYARTKPEKLIEKLQSIQAQLTLTMLSNRGVRVWPNGQPETFCVDQWRCRYTSSIPITQEAIIEILSKLTQSGMDFIKIENLYDFNDKPGYSNAEKKIK